MARSEEDKISDGIAEDRGLSKSVSAITMSPELFEKLYLTPKVPHAGDYNKRFANPTPLGFLGFVISTFTFAMVMMGWGGASGLSPVLPTLGLSSPYATAADKTGAASPEYNAVIALYLIVWGFALFTFFIFTLKINTVFALIFFFVSVAAWVLSGAYWKVSKGEYEIAGHLQKVCLPYVSDFRDGEVLICLKAGGALLFIVAALGWYMCFIIMAGEMRITLKLPVGDLSHFWPKTDVELAIAERA
ncbi:hypothetical protein NA57DRAFT_47830 [Rhizodiscina lignyota]|uniref:Uncharacterized protein n=1 Tax=Rhizodiscina lignyota TaxID=1504668 RepID=A0A9P4M0E8_9PEZI|nr:hypothetical protein NA57DRAFT_47830 [Rhizodiscina lignyota]